MISGAAQMNNYLEGTLRYASYLTVTDTEPNTDALKTFISKCYDNKLKIKSADEIERAQGKLYVMHIDNKAGGKITKRTYDYTAGGSFAMDTDTKADPVISGGALDSSINEAIYNDYNYNISLGMYRTTATGTSGALYTLVRDDSFYAYNTNNFGRNNFGFTITAYPTTYPTGRERNEMRDTYGMKDEDDNAVTRIGDATSGHTFYNATYYASSISFENMVTTITYPMYKRDSTKKVLVEDGKPLFDTKEVDPDSRFANSFLGTSAEPDNIYIIFTYADDEINKS
jgi:hypothetical protein